MVTPFPPLPRNYSILSPGDVLLGKLHVVFQLHEKTPSKEGVSKEGVSTTTGPRLAEVAPSTAVEFVVGPGAPVKPQTRSIKSTVLREDRSEVRVVEGSKVTGSPVVAERCPESCDVEQLGETQAIGSQQMEVISELLEKGTKLRDKMVQSLSAGIHLDHTPR